MPSKELPKSREKKNNLPTLFKRNYKQEIEEPYKEFHKMLTTRQNGIGYYHLTTWSNLCKMLTMTTVPDDSKKHMMLHLGAAVNMNDENDKRCGKRVFFTSFSFGPTENISMWTNYGIPNQEAVRIKFKNGAIQYWLKRYNKGLESVYGVNDDGSLVPLSKRPEVKLVQVAYWSKKEYGPRKEKPNEGLFFYDNEKYHLLGCKDINKWMAETPYMFKEFGWDYEREVRLVLVFDEDMADQYKKVAVTFDGPYNTLLKNFEDHVTRGPWFDEKKSPKKKAGGHTLREAKKSRFHGVVKMRSVCDNCELKGTNQCKCPFQGQR